MTRTELQKLARQRVRESRTLLDKKLYAGAYYLAGYAVECAIKACIAKRVRKHEFPDKKLAQKSHTHGLQDLVKVAGLERDLEKKKNSDDKFRANWGIVKDWTVDSRYDLYVSIARAKALYSAIQSRKHGVMSWVTSLW